jgi:hypothetical protein
MSDYCCFFLDERDQVSATEDLMDRQDDAEASYVAVMMLSERPHHHAVEVWNGSRMISRHLKTQA